MKYKLLSKEQLKALHQEFAQFLATQQINADEWNAIKINHPKMAEEELSIFSDMVWEDVLGKTTYLEHFSEQNINLFKCNSREIIRIVVQVKKEGFNFFNDQDYQWFIDNTTDNSIQFFRGAKSYSKERNLELFDLIEKGSVISDGKLFESLFKLIT